MAKELRLDRQTRGTQTVLSPNALTVMSNQQTLKEKKTRELGSIYTPPDLAQFLTSWAIRNQTDKVLDIGIGEGVFTFAAYERLQKLGATATEAQNQLFGSEIDKDAYHKFLEHAKINNISFPHLQNANFFDIDFPFIDAIVGNPPYVRRTYIDNIDEIRIKVIQKNTSHAQLKISRMTDMYIYFLLHALPRLKPGGKLAVITADSWMNVDYGEAFKQYLWQHFSIETLISLDRRIFNNALVKPVLILATKKIGIDREQNVQFIRIKNGSSILCLQDLLHNPGHQHSNIARATVNYSNLKAFIPWSIHFKAPEIYEELAVHQLMTPVKNIAETRIGLQTLAKEFFVLSPEKAKDKQIEKEYLEPLAQSLKYFYEPVISTNTAPPFYLFSCKKEKENLRGTCALQHILWGEHTAVEVRGKGIQVTGYHNKERIKRSNRKFWYDLQSSLERRGRAPILIPRLVYRTFRVIWNQAGFVPGELFIEFIPPAGIDIEIYLAILNSSLNEFMLRTHAQIYGGGTFNINPGKIKDVPMLNVAFLTNSQREQLKQAYLNYLSNATYDRSKIDNVISNILGFDSLQQKRINDLLSDLVQLATLSKKKNPQYL